MTEHKFDPEWPHGHILIDKYGRRWKARIIGTIMGPAPVAAAVSNSRGEEDVMRFKSDGTPPDDDRDRIFNEERLINAPAPEPTRVDLAIAKAHLIPLLSANGQRWPEHWKVTIHAMSDGTFRASAEVMP